MAQFLIFADETKIPVRVINGGSTFVQGYARDVLTIEIDPSVATLTELKDMFEDITKTKTLKNQIINDESGEEILNLMGDNYSIYISASNEFRDVSQEPGTNSMPMREEVNVVKIAQKTYQEIELENIREFMANLQK